MRDGPRTVAQTSRRLPSGGAGRPILAQSRADGLLPPDPSPRCSDARPRGAATLRPRGPDSSPVWWRLFGGVAVTIAHSSRRASFRNAGPPTLAQSRAGDHPISRPKARGGPTLARVGRRTPIAAIASPRARGTRGLPATSFRWLRCVPMRATSWLHAQDCGTPRRRRRRSRSGGGPFWCRKGVSSS